MGAPTAPRAGFVAVVTLAGAWLLLMVPESTPAIVASAGREAFAWSSDARWEELERRFTVARTQGCQAVAPEIDAGFAAVDASVATLDRGPRPPDDPIFRAIEDRAFALAATTGACPARASELVALHERVRAAVKRQSRAWDMSDRTARNTVYRLLYGGRTAVEEVLLQVPPEMAPGVSHGMDEPSGTPSVEVHGVRVHSGDILASRGGAPTSALIARGNDYPGNFSHIALVHVDAPDGTVSVIEAHIEAGVVVSTAEQYLADKKLRIMLLRPRADLPQLVADPLLPHRAATAALEEARSGHVPYDFAMDWRHHERQFCVEVATGPYAARGLVLWDGMSSFSSRGLARWLAGLGVRHMETQAPADIEYDPNLVVVAEWRDRDALAQDRMDNAVVEAMLEGAEEGDDLAPDVWMLPVARVAKAWSTVLNAFDIAGPVPEGMSATAALRAQRLAQLHAKIKARVADAADHFEQGRGYRPPYWELVRMANEARSSND